MSFFKIQFSKVVVYVTGRDVIIDEVYGKNSAESIE